MEMIYHRLAYLLILHHWNHMHNTNHKDFSRVVTGFRIKVRNIWECSSKAIETSGAKMNQLKIEYIRHVKPIMPFNSFHLCITYKQTPFFFLFFFSPILHQQWNLWIKNENMFYFISHSHTTNLDTPTLISCTPYIS